MAKKGWDQSLDNGVMNKPSIPGPQDIQGRTKMNFFEAIAFGENEHGQTTKAPAQVVRGGKVVYNDEDYPKGQSSHRWKPKKY